MGKSRHGSVLNKNSDLLQQESIKLIATGTTGSKAEKAGFKVKKMLSGPMGDANCGESSRRKD
jgi:methylglyoxal synthase